MGHRQLPIHALGHTLGLAVAVAMVAAGCEPPNAADIGYLECGQVVCPRGATVEGIDVSHWNGVIDWNNAKGAGITFAVMKATEHLNFVDNTFATNWKGAGQAGVIRGAYHFFRPAFDGVMQADFFLQTAGMAGPGDLPPTLDLEAVDGVAAKTVAARALDFLNRVEQQTGRTPIVYTSASFMNSIGNPVGFGRFPLWVAHWKVQCPNIPSPEWKDWHFWQYSDVGVDGGLSGADDLDRFNGTLADLMAFVRPAMPDAGGIADLAAPRDLRGAPDLSGPADGSPAADPDLAAAAPADLSQMPQVKRDLWTPSLDHGMAPAPAAGCGCSVGGADRGPLPPVLLLMAPLLFGVEYVLRRHRRPAR